MFLKSPASSKEAFIIKWKLSRPKGHGNGYSNGQPSDHGIVMATPMLTAMDNRIARAMDSPMDNQMTKAIAMVMATVTRTHISEWGIIPKQSMQIILTNKYNFLQM